MFEIVKGTTAVTNLATFTAAATGSPNSGVTLDSSGDLFGTTQFQSTTGEVYELVKGSTTPTLLVTLNSTNGGPPVAVTIDTSGNAFGVTEYGGTSGDGTVFEVVKNSHAVTTLATFNSNNGTDLTANVILDTSGNIYGITSNGGPGGAGTVFEIVKNSNEITNLVTFNSLNGAYPYAGVTLDSSGDVFGTAGTSGK